MIRRRSDRRMTVWGRHVHALARSCARCGATLWLVAAHIFARRTHPALRYDVENGLRLCDTCHTWFDANRTRALAWVDERWPGRLAYLRTIEGRSRSGGGRGY